MIKGISVWAFDGKRPLKEVFALAKEQGFRSVEPAIAVDGPITPQTTTDECKRIADEARAAGVELSSLASGGGWGLPIATTDKETSRKGIDFVAASLRVARDLGVDSILLVPGTVTTATPYDKAYDIALAGIKELVPVAEEMGVTIGVENVWNKFLLSPLEMRDFIDGAGSKRVGCYFDTGNVLVNGFPEQWIEILGKRITRVHFKDFKNSIGTIEGFCDLLEGDVDYNAVMNSLRAIGYNGYVTAEFFGCEGDLAKISKGMDEILAK